MAMACAVAAAATMSSSAAFASSSSRISPASSSSTSATATSVVYRSVQVRCSQVEESTKAKAVSRREVFSLATLSLVLAASEKAEAKDIPLFGIRKKVEQAEKAVEKEVKELEKEGSALLQAGEKELAKDVQAVSSAVSEFESEATSGLSPTLQAGGVVGAELVAVLVASSVVNGLISVPSK